MIGMFWYMEGLSPLQQLIFSCPADKTANVLFLRSVCSLIKQLEVCSSLKIIFSDWFLFLWPLILHRSAT